MVGGLGVADHPARLSAARACVLALVLARERTGFRRDIPLGALLVARGLGGKPAPAVGDVQVDFFLRIAARAGSHPNHCLCLCLVTLTVSHHASTLGALTYVGQQTFPETGVQPRKFPSGLRQTHQAPIFSASWWLIG